MLTQIHRDYDYTNIICHLPYFYYAHARGLQILSYGDMYGYAVTDCFYNLQTLIAQFELFAALVMNRR